MRIGAWVDGNHTKCTLLFKLEDLAREGKAFRDNDLALDILRRTCLCILVFFKHRVDRTAERGGHMDQRGS